MNASYLSQPAEDSEDSSLLIDSLLASLKNGQPVTPKRRILTPSGQKFRLPMPKTATPAQSVKGKNSILTTPQRTTPKAATPKGATPSKELYPSLSGLVSPALNGQTPKKALGDATPFITNVVPPSPTPFKTPTGILKLTTPGSNLNNKFAGIESAGQKILDELRAKTASAKATAKDTLVTSPKEAAKKVVKKVSTRFEEAHRREFEKSGSILDHYAARRPKPPVSGTTLATPQPKRLKRTSSVAQLDVPTAPSTPKAMQNTPTIRFVQTTVTKRVKFSDNISSVQESPTPSSATAPRRPPPVPPKDNSALRTPSRPPPTPAKATTPVTAPNPHRLSLVKSAPPKRGSSLVRTISGRNLFPNSTRLTKVPVGAPVVGPAEKELPALPAQASPKRRIQNALVAPMTAFTSRTASKIPVIEPGHASEPREKEKAEKREKILQRDGEFTFKAVARNLKFPTSAKAKVAAAALKAATPSSNGEDGKKKEHVEKVEYTDPFNMPSPPQANPPTTTTTTSNMSSRLTAPTASSLAKRTTTTTQDDPSTPARKRVKMDPTTPVAATPSRLPVPKSASAAQGNAISTPWREVKSRVKGLRGKVGAGRGIRK